MNPYPVCTGRCHRFDALQPGQQRCEDGDPRTNWPAPFASTCWSKLVRRPTAWLQFDGRQFPAGTSARAGRYLPFVALVIHRISPNVAANCNWHPKGLQVFADHHRYSREDLSNVAEPRRQAGATALVCTHKDLVKVGCNQIGGLPVYALLIEIEFLAGQSEFEAKLLFASAPSLNRSRTDQQSIRSRFTSRATISRRSQRCHTDRLSTGVFLDAPNLRNRRNIELDAGFFGRLLDTTAASLNQWIDSSYLRVQPPCSLAIRAGRNSHRETVANIHPVVFDSFQTWQDLTTGVRSWPVAE